MNFQAVWHWLVYENRSVRTLQLASLIRYVCSFLMGVILIKAGTDIGLVGRIEFFLFMAALLSTFWIQGIKNGMLAYYPDSSHDRKETFFLETFLTLAALSLLILGLYYSVEKSLAVLDYSQVSIVDYSIYLALCILFLIPASLGDYILFLKGKNKGVLIFACFFSVGQLVLIVWCLMTGLSIEQMLRLLVGFYALKFVTVFIIAAFYSEFHIQLNRAVPFFIFSFPLILHALMGVMMESLDSWLVSIYFDESVFVKFRYGARELPFSILLVSGVVGAMIPLYKMNKKSALQQMYSEVSRLLPLLFIGGSVMMLISPWLFKTMYNDSFLISAHVFNIYILVLLSRIVLPSIIFYGNNKNWQLLAFGFVELIANIVLSIFLLQRIGMLGIAWATVIVYSIHTIGLVIYAYVYLGEKLSTYLDIKKYCLYAALLIIAFTITQYLY